MIPVTDDWYHLNLIAVAKRADEICKLTGGAMFEEDMLAAIEGRRGSCGRRSIDAELAEIRGWLEDEGYLLIQEPDAQSRMCWVVVPDPVQSLNTGGRG
ncbi:hypothetical protein AWB91_09035 [Mycobacterium paraense]|uniref:Uncharacterized protein n=1 Tax=Mycobacterium paraense TaxID=767916 RepID=A0ABX3VSZ1_9MYCO|nr:hypothetical protein [Mycobacterium paraense]ORW33260.1 hypothetical protein AWB91_09035 [Mycobacterium paraense]ORW34679.1 hypothetical protein AWB88_02740 [Mycobacterium paraense]